MAAQRPTVSQLVSAPAASAAASAFGQLSAAISMPRDGRTLEDVVRELLNPLLAAWLDEHLPAIVQAKVDEEVERIARAEYARRSKTAHPTRPRAWPGHESFVVGSRSCRKSLRSPLSRDERGFKHPPPQSD